MLAVWNDTLCVLYMTLPTFSLLLYEPFKYEHFLKNLLTRLLQNTIPSVKLLITTRYVTKGITTSTQATEYSIEQSGLSIEGDEGEMVSLKWINFSLYLEFSGKSFSYILNNKNTMLKSCLTDFSPKSANLLPNSRGLGSALMMGYQSVTPTDYILGTFVLFS